MIGLERYSPNSCGRLDHSFAVSYKIEHDVCSFTCGGCFRYVYNVHDAVLNSAARACFKLKIEWKNALMELILLAFLFNRRTSPKSPCDHCRAKRPQPRSRCQESTSLIDLSQTTTCSELQSIQPKLVSIETKKKNWWVMRHDQTALETNRTSTNATKQTMLADLLAVAYPLSTESAYFKTVKGKIKW